MAVGTPTLKKKRVKKIKLAIIAGESLTDLADKHGVGYMAIYKIATGKSWDKVEPRGRLIGKRDYSARRVMTLKLCQLIALLKIKKGASNKKLTKWLKVKKGVEASESTITRAIRDGRASLAVRVHKMTLTSGGTRSAKKKFGITEEDVEALVALAVSDRIPGHVRKEIEGRG